MKKYISLISVLVLLVAVSSLLCSAGKGSVGPGKSPKAAEPSATAFPLYRVNALDLKRSGDVELSKLLRVRVVRVVDGDTIKVEPTGPWPADFARAEKVRLLGVDTPETVHPKKKVEYFGKEASAYTKQSLLGKEVFLAFDWQLRDYYGRLLCYVYLADGTCFNARLVCEGYGYAYLKYAFAFKDEFSRLGTEAREKKRGLWKK